MSMGEAEAWPRLRGPSRSWFWDALGTELSLLASVSGPPAASGSEQGMPFGRAGQEK